MPASTRSIGSGTPITPVEQTSTSSPAPVSSPVSAAIRSASARPCAPVATFALPLETTTARAVPLAARRSRHSSTGAPAARLRVNTPAAVAGPSATTSATSGRPGGLDPARRARRPEAARVGDAYGHRPSRGQAGALVEAEHQVGVLDRLAGGALDEVVERGGDDRGARARGRLNAATATAFEPARRCGAGISPRRMNGSPA